MRYGIPNVTAKAKMARRSMGFLSNANGETKPKKRLVFLLNGYKAFTTEAKHVLGGGGLTFLSLLVKVLLRENLCFHNDYSRLIIAA